MGRVTPVKPNVRRGYQWNDGCPAGGPYPGNHQRRRACPLQLPHNIQDPSADDPDCLKRERVAQPARSAYLSRLIRLEVSQRFPPMCLYVGIKLVYQGGHRKPGAIALGLVENQTQVFAHPVDGKSKIKLVGNHGLATVVESANSVPPLCQSRPAPGSYPGRLLAKGDGLAQALYQAGNGKSG
jgi:hypothetical protein